MKQTLADANRLMMEGAAALATVQENGIHIDVPHLERKKRQLKRRITRTRDALERTDLIRAWRKRYRSRFNLDSDTQLGNVLYEDLELEPHRLTDKGNPSVDADALEHLDLPEIHDLLKLRKYKQTLSTFVEGLLRETVDGFVHPFFNLHLVRTFRSSSSRPNFQNIPKRDKEIKAIVRQAIIPRPGNRLLELDYKGIEVRIAACYHEDPNIIRDIEDPTLDMHRDASMSCYKILDPKQVTSDIRYSGKNGFVFPEFYGDYYGNCARSLWGNVEGMGLKLKDGTSLRDHLTASGMSKYRTFEHHIEEIERDFWNNRFTVYRDWKDTWHEQYLKLGYLDTLTGFRCSGLLSRNDAINHPVQGSAFHCLLWTLIQLERWLIDNDMKSKIIGQIHDSIVMDAVPEEVEAIRSYLRRTACDRIRRHWPWIIVPLEIESELGEIDGSWNEMKELEQ